MIIETKQLNISDELKRKVELICRFVNVDYTFTNGNIKSIKKTNIAYVKSHRIIIKGITFLAFNYSKTLYVDNLSNKLELNALETLY